MKKKYYTSDGIALDSLKYPSHNSTRFVEYEKGRELQYKIPCLYEKREACCGCSACYTICPQDAIIMEPDEEGYFYPVVNLKECIGCLLCTKVCPIKKAKGKCQ